jgi:hypothetical protein
MSSYSAVQRCTNHQWTKSGALKRRWAASGRMAPKVPPAMATKLPSSRRSMLPKWTAMEAVMAVLNTPTPLVMVKAGALTAPALVTYKSPSPIQDLAIRQRKNAGPWTDRLKEPLPDDDTLTSGEYYEALSPGDRYQAEAYDKVSVAKQGFPESVGSADRLGEVTIFALRAPTTFPLTEPFGPEVGGTYMWGRVSTIPRKTWARLEVGSARPELDENGVLSRIKDPLHAKTSDIKEVHEFEIAPLLPGNRFFYVLTIADVGVVDQNGQLVSDGSWQQIIGEFTTLLRKVDVSLKDLVIQHPGDDDDWSDKVRFAFQIREGDPHTVVNDRVFNLGQVTANPPYNKIDLATNYPCSATIGPKAIPSDKAGMIRIHLLGVEEDTGPLNIGFFFDPDDVAEVIPQSGQPLNFPSGRFKEAVNADVEKIAASVNDQDDEFSFYVTVEYSVSYSPP